MPVKNVLRLGVGMLGAALASCAVPHSLMLSADLPPAESMTGAGVSIGLSVSDNRAPATGGRDETAETDEQRSPVVEIGTARVVEFLEDALREGLEARGFTVLSASAEGVAAVLTVDVQAFDFLVEKGFGSVGLKTKVAVKAKARNEQTEYRAKYTHDWSDDVLLPPTEGEAVSSLNEGSSEVLGRLFHDRALLSVLAGGKGIL